MIDINFIKKNSIIIFIIIILIIFFIFKKDYPENHYKKVNAMDSFCRDFSTSIAVYFIPKKNNINTFSKIINKKNNIFINNGKIENKSYSLEDTENIINYVISRGRVFFYFFPNIQLLIIDKIPNEDEIKKTYNTIGKINLLIYVKQENDKEGKLSAHIYFTDENGDFIMDDKKNKIVTCGFDNFKVRE